LLAQVVVDKYADHLPLYRQEQRFRREGVRLGRQTLCGWLPQLDRYTGHIVKAMKQDIFDGGFIQVDETPIPMQTNRRPKTRAWGARPGDRRLVLRLQPDHLRPPDFSTGAHSRPRAMPATAGKPSPPRFPVETQAKPGFRGDYWASTSTSSMYQPAYLPSLFSRSGNLDCSPRPLCILW
jgi:hypothetical protein